MTIRQCQSSDITRVMELQSEWQRAFSGYHPWGDDELLAAAINPYFIVAEVDGVVVGYVLGHPRRGMPEHVTIQDWFVTADHEGSGIGRALFRTVLDLARTNNRVGVWLSPVGADRDELVKTYERRGFERRGETEMFLDLTKPH